MRQRMGKSPERVCSGTGCMLRVFASQYLWGPFDLLPQAYPSKGQDEWSIRPLAPMPPCLLVAPKALTSFLELTGDWALEKGPRKQSTDQVYAR